MCRRASEHSVESRHRTLGRHRPQNCHSSEEGEVNANEWSARSLVAFELTSSAGNVCSEEERGAYFDSRNRDVWMDAFIDHLRSKYQKPDRIASND